MAPKAKKCDLFKSQGKEHAARRKNRQHMRTQRKKMKKAGKTRSDTKYRSGSRAKPVECCGKLKKNCTCFKPGCAGRDISKAFQTRRGKACLKSLEMAEIVTDLDVWDVPLIRDSLEYDNEHDSLWWLWGCAMTLRLYNSEPTIKMLLPSLIQHRNNSPDYDGSFKTALRKAYARADVADAKEPQMHGGLYRTPVLQSYSLDGGCSWLQAPEDRVARDVLGIRLVWRALPRATLTLYQQSPSRDFWKAALQQFQENLANSVSGLAGDYMTKCMLDVVVMSGAVQHGTISHWPVNCPAYLANLQLLYPGVPKQMYFLAMCHWHAFMNETRILSFPAALAHLC